MQGDHQIGLRYNENEQSAGCVNRHLFANTFALLASRVIICKCCVACFVAQQSVDAGLT